MTNRIVRVDLFDHILEPAVAEVWVVVHVERVTPTTEVRGRLMGPTCPYASTVEVSYPLRPPAKGQAAPAFGHTTLTMRVVIPEPSMWDPQCPFLYHGPVELWQDGQRCDRATVRHGCYSMTLDPHGMRWNGRPLPLQGREVGACSEEEMRALHDTGVNLLIAPVIAETAPLWERADRLGFLMFGRVTALDDPLLDELGTHTSSMGFLVDAASWGRENAAKRSQFRTRTCGLVGTESLGAPEVDFVLAKVEGKAGTHELRQVAAARGK